MFRLAVLAALCAGLTLCADDPPKTLTPEERKELFDRWNKLMDAGEKASRAGDLAAAAKAFDESLRLARQIYPKNDYPDGHANLAVGLSNLALLYQTQGKWALAEPHAREALEMQRRLFKGDHLHVATSLTNLAMLHRVQGNLSEAESYLKESLEMHRRLFNRNHSTVAEILNSLAVLYWDQGKPSDAEPLAKESLEIYRRLYKGDHRRVALSLNNVAAMYRDQGKLAEAETLCKDALEMRRRLFKGDHPDVADSLNNLGTLYTAQAKLAEADALLKEALEMQRRLFKGDHPSVATSLNNLAYSSQAQGKWAEAESLVKETLEIRRRLLRGDHPHVASSLNNLAALYQVQGKFTEAEPLFKDALEMQRRLYRGDHPTVATNLSNLAALYQAQGKLVEARTFARDALAMFRRLTAAMATEKREGEALTFVGSLPLTRSGFLSVAMQAKCAPETVYPEVWSDRSAVVRIYERRQQAARAATDPKAMKLIAELADTRRRQSELLLAPGTNDLGTRQKREDDIKAYEKRIIDLDRELRPLLPTIGQAERLSNSTAAELQRRLPADAAVVDFLGYVHLEFDNSKPIGEKDKRTSRYTAFVLTKEAIAWVDLDTAERIDAAVNAWRKAITGGENIPVAIPSKVRELVWEKVRKELPPNIKTVHIAPDLALCRVPWGALPGDKPGTVLLEDFAIATIPHAPFLLDKFWPQDPIKNPPTGSLVVGDVNFDVETTTGPANRDLPIKPGTKVAWQALPGAAAEATGVESAAKKKGTVTALKGEAATPAAVLAALPKTKYAHFATHGFFADPSFRSAFQLDEKDFRQTWQGERIGRAALSPLVMTGLVFAGANNPKTPGRGIVTGEALVDLDLSGLELAVLSACETGLGDVAGGEGTFGLQRAFHLAGTRDVVASLWKVPDQPTAALMAEFYRNLWEKNLTPMESLRQAQLTIYRNPGKIAELAAGFRAGFKEVKSDEVEIKPTADGKAHPKQWAAFTLSGPGR